MAREKVPQPLVGFVVDIGAVGVPVTSDGALPKGVSLSRQTLETLKFTGKVGETYVIAQDKGAALILVGVGELSKLKVASLRKAAASLARAAAHGTHEGAGRSTPMPILLSSSTL